MELILKETINSLGREGDVVKVKPGFGRNYLLPQGKAVIADARNRAVLEKNRAAIEARRTQERKQAEALAAKLAGVSLEISQLVGEDERLFGSVTSADICEELAKRDIIIDKRQVLLATPIKTIGITTVPIKVGFDVAADVKVNVIAQTHE